MYPEIDGDNAAGNDLNEVLMVDLMWELLLHFLENIIHK